jgi:hypothetical protein
MTWGSTHSLSYPSQRAATFALKTERAREIAPAEERRRTPQTNHLAPPRARGPQPKPKRMLE